ncbi:MAG TPA: hypothetical protein VMD74_02145 [Candidatus Methylomirabilis sp.]|nr:hypothetical protein [Candidatus Methylomirabilis sp.]
MKKQMLSAAFALVLSVLFANCGKLSGPSDPIAPVNSVTPVPDRTDPVIVVLDSTKHFQWPIFGGELKQPVGNYFFSFEGGHNQGGIYLRNYDAPALDISTSSESSVAVRIVCSGNNALYVESNGTYAIEARGDLNGAHFHGGMGDGIKVEGVVGGEFNSTSADGYAILCNNRARFKQGIIANDGAGNEVDLVALVISQQKKIDDQQAQIADLAARLAKLEKK